MNSQDTELVRLAIQGNPDSFAQLTAKYSRSIYSLSFNRVGNHADAEEIAQDVFVTAFFELHSLREPEKFASWIHTIARNRCMKWLSQKQKVVSFDHLQILPYKPGFELEDEIVRRENQQKMRSLINNLSNENRASAILVYLHGLSIRETSNRLGIPVGTVKTRLFRARHQIRKEMLNMVEEVGTLSSSFADNVITVIKELLLSLEKIRTTDLMALQQQAEKIFLHRWKEVFAFLPKQSQGSITGPFRITELPEDIRWKAIAAMQWCWLYSILYHIGAKAPWMEDINVLWFRFVEDEKGFYLTLADTCEKSGCIHNVLITHDEAFSSWQGLNIDNVPTEGLNIIQEIKQALKACGIVEPNRLIQVTKSQLVAKLKTVKRLLPIDLELRMHEGDRLSVKPLSSKVHTELIDVVKFYQLWRMLRAFAKPPLWIERLEDASVEFEHHQGMTLVQIGILEIKNEIKLWHDGYQTGLR